ncbi:PQQ-like beta-propeller repeat protein [Candidatus Sulfurimonas baltica]|uniref:PQQ-like beta-propeller repeat protein n=1 Tax=Candidatus Sulfurimonas baltica TaxID=2740404 RepID=UPI001E440538|nr:PQQ-like beta-propeller repeat protein [Candidatus Sulfurimonas baltica]
MKLLSLILITTTAIFFNACSSKEVYEPKNVVDSWAKAGSSDVTIENIASDSALVQERKVLVEGKVLNIKISDNYKLLGYSDGWVISSNIDGNLTMQSVENSAKVESFDLKKTIATASVKDDVLAVLFIDNEIALYSISTKSILLKEQGDTAVVVNSKIVKPYFKDDLILFSTLDGKVVIINSTLKKKLRTIIVSSENYFNNIIYFNLVDNKIIAATGHKILSFSNKEIRAKYDIRSVVDDGKTIFLNTKQGEVVALTPELKENAKVKFPFAHFLGMIVTSDKLYVLEKEGYLIEMSKDLLEYKVYDVDVDDGYIFIDDKIFYVVDEYISVE